MRNARFAESWKCGMPEERRKNVGIMSEERRSESEDGQEKSDKREGCREIWKL